MERSTETVFAYHKSDGVDIQNRQLTFKTQQHVWGEIQRTWFLKSPFQKGHKNGSKWLKDDGHHLRDMQIKQLYLHTEKGYYPKNQKHWVLGQGWSDSIAGKAMALPRGDPGLTTGIQYRPLNFTTSDSWALSEAVNTAWDGPQTKPRQKHVLVGGVALLHCHWKHKLVQPLWKMVK